MSELKITSFYVGDGDCILIQFPNGKLGLIDSCKPSWATSSPALSRIKNLGGELEFVCMTHPHVDHFGGMNAILNDAGIKVKEFWDSLSDLKLALNFHNTGVSTNPVLPIARRMHADMHEEFIEIYKSVNRLKIKRTKLSDFKQLPTIDGVEIHSLAPFSENMDKYNKRMLGYLSSLKTLNEDTANEISAVLWMKYAGKHILLGADAPTKTWQRLLHQAARRSWSDKLRSDVFKVSHHGAKDWHLNILLTAINPSADKKVAVVSAGSSTHPTEETLKDLKAAQWAVYKTGKRTNKALGRSGQAPAAHRVSKVLFDSYSSPISPNVCCGDVTVTICAAGSVSVSTQYAPQCGICG